MCYFCVPHLGKLFVFGCQVPTCFATWFVDGSRFRSEPKQKPMFIVPKQKPMFLKYFPDNFWNHFFGDREWVYVTRAYPGESESWPPMILPTWTLGRWVPKLPQNQQFERKSFINCWWNIRGIFQGYVGGILERTIFQVQAVIVQITPVQVNWIHLMFVGLKNYPVITSKPLKVGSSEPHQDMPRRTPPSQQVFGIKTILI